MIVRGFILSTPGEYAAISDLVRVHACPVRFYYERLEPVSESDRYAVCKQLSYHLGKELDPTTIWGEVTAVRPVTDPAAKEFLALCIAACSKKEWKPASQTDVRVFSGIQRMAGMIDRITDEGTFSIIRASGAMPFGAYAADRLRIAAIALCLEEMTGSEVKGGNIEYIPDGVARFHEVQPRDRRMVIATLHKLREIREGAMPQHPLNAPCKRCRYHEKCESSVGKRLSEAPVTAYSGFFPHDEQR